MEKGEYKITNISDTLSYEFGIINKIASNAANPPSFSIVEIKKDGTENPLLTYGSEELANLDITEEVQKALSKASPK